MIPAASAAIRDTLKVLGSNLAVNLSSFLILAFAARTMKIEAFAQLSLIVAASQMGSSILDLGTNFSTVKRHAEARDARYLSTLVWIKLAVSLSCCVVAALLYASHQQLQWVCIVVCAAAINLWSGTRALEQARQDFAGLAYASTVFAALRTALGLVGVSTGNPIITAFAFFAGPVVAVALSEARKVSALMGPFDRSAAASVLRYALPAYLSSMFYNIFLYYPQFVVAHRHDSKSAAMFGVLLTFLGPLALFNTSIRLYLLPRVASNEVRRSEILANPRAMMLVGSVVALGVGAIAAGAMLIARFYEPVYPGMALPLGIFISFYFVTAVAGFFNIDLHRMGGAVVEARLNAARLLVLIVLLGLFGHNFMSIVLISAVTMLLGELALFALTSRIARDGAALDGSSPATAFPYTFWHEAGTMDDTALLGWSRPLAAEARQSSAFVSEAKPAAAPTASAVSLRFAIVCRDLPLQPWQQRAVDLLLGGGHRFAGVVRLDVAVAGSKPALPDGTALIDCAATEDDAQCWHVAESDVAAIEALDLDFVLLFGVRRCSAELLQVARHGAWTFAGFDAGPDKYAPPAYWPLFHGDPHTTAALVRLAPQIGQDTVLKRGTLRTRRTYQSNLAVIGNVMAEWPSTIATMLAAGCGIPDETMSADEWQHAVRQPTAVHHLSSALKAVPRFCRRINDFAFCFDVWEIGVANCDMRTILEHGVPKQIDWAPAPAFGTFVADPMPLDAAGRTRVLYEWFSYWTSKGDIRSREYSAETGWSARAEPFLAEPFHLSYPGVWELGGGSACIPECTEAGVSYLYPLAADGTLTGERAVFSDVPVADPTLLQHEGRWYLFGALAAEAQYQLRIWYADTPLGPWLPHPANPVKCDVHTARPAGPFVRIDDGLYRPSQGSSVSYGSSANLMQVLELSPTAFHEVVAREILPDPDWRCSRGIHTLSPIPGGVLIDAKRVHVSPLALIVRVVNVLQARRGQQRQRNHNGRSEGSKS